MINSNFKFLTDQTDPLIEIKSLGNGNTIDLRLDQIGVTEVSDLLIFRSDNAAGQNREQIGIFSILEDDQLPGEYNPSFTVDSSKISVGNFLGFELINSNSGQVATATALGGNRVSLDFGEGTKLSFRPTTASNVTNLLLDDAATIDIRTQKKREVTLSVSVYREADFDNTIGFYEVDKADGTIISDSLLGTRIRPGEAGYKEAALGRALDARLTGKNDEVETFSVDIDGTGFFDNTPLGSTGLFGVFLIADGSSFASDEIYFSHSAANRSGNDHVKMLGNNTFGFEDMAGLGDQDYNDIVVAFNLA